MAIIIEPWRIPEEGKDIDGEESSEVLALEPAAGVSAEAPIQYSLHVQCVSNELIITGTLSTDIKFTCSLCAEPFVVKIRDASFFYEKHIDNLHETQDLTDEVRETIILDFPNYPVCQETCRGLCARCGKNLNRERCGCKPAESEKWSAFSGLDKIEVKNGST